MDERETITVENVSKKYCKNLKKSMYYGIHDITRNFFGLSSKSNNLRKDEFWAIKNVSFNVRKGETLGLIGPNGSGKSTMLKMLNGIFWPDVGKITINGKVGALIEVGAGFHPMLTGNENIYVNAAILGMNKKETEEKFEEIIQFAEIGDFLDTPIKFYSSGMLVRLGFSIAVHCEPDVLLIDEILAVGDVGFRAKCYNKMAELREYSAMVFVSHDMSAISRICSDCILLNNGKNIYCGNTEKAIQQYEELFKNNIQSQSVLGSGEAIINEIEILNEYLQAVNEINFGDAAIIRLNLDISKKYDGFLISITFMNINKQIIAQLHSGYNNVKLVNRNETLNIKIKIPEIPFNPGIYSMNVIVYDNKNMKYLSWMPEAIKFKVLGAFYGGNNIQLSGEWIID